jgi:hypothetical protein
LGLKVARELYEDDGMETLTEEDEEFEKLPVTSTDEVYFLLTNNQDFRFLGEMSVEDEDVLMLFEMPFLANGSTLHPSEWFTPFDQSLIGNHLPDEVEAVE